MIINLGEDKTKFLHEVYVYDFNDNYHRLSSEPSSELEKAARRIRRRYRHVSDYMDALAVYNEYMALMIQKHGGPQLFKLKLKNETIEDFMPAKPQMKSNETNKLIMKHKILLSTVKSKVLNTELLEEIEEELEDMIPRNVRALTLDPSMHDRVANQILKTETFDVKLSNKKLSHADSISYLEEYFLNKNVIAKKNKEKEQELYSMKEIMSDDYETLIQDTEEKDDVIYYQGKLLHRSAVQELQTYQDMAQYGWNSLKLMRSKGVSKKLTNHVKSQKKANKKKKKGKKSEGDDFLQYLVDDTGGSFADFEKDMLNFTSDNVFK